MKQLVIILLIILCSGNLFGQPERLCLYISTNGDNKNDGSREHPLASLAGARDRIRKMRQQYSEGRAIVVYVMPGNYYMKEPLKLLASDSGAEQENIEFTASENDRPVFYGGIKLDRFEELKPGLWRVFIPEVARYGFYFEQLYINGERRFRAQTPDHGRFFYVNNVAETLLDEPGRQFASLKITPFPEDAGFLDSLDTDNLSDALVRFHHKWDVTKRFIQHINRNDTALYFTGQGMKLHKRIDRKSRFVIENYRKALDAPGEWFLSRDGYLYYIPCPGETVDNTECMAPVLEKFIEIEGDQKNGKYVEHIRFENLCFRVAGYKTPPGGNDPAQAAAPVESTIMLDFAKNISFQNCEVAHTGLNGIWFRRACFDCELRHCHLYDLGGGGVKIGERAVNDLSTLTHYIVINNNIIQHGGYVFPQAAGVIVFKASDNSIIHNDIADFRYSGISVGWVWGYGYSPSKRNKIEFNHIHHLGWGELSDMGGIYTLGVSDGTTVSNNMVHNIYSYDYGGWGLYADEGSSGIVMKNNLVYACKSAGFMQHYGKENMISNNIFAFNIRAQVQLGRVEDQSLSFTRNIVYFDKGPLFYSNAGNYWSKVLVDIDYNCYHKTFLQNTDFDGVSYREWQDSGKDIHSTIEDPMFVDTENYDFHFKNRKVAQKIGFRPFDNTQAGVYGDDRWKNLALLDTILLKKFDRMVNEFEKAE